jgi:hypothetical protein
VDEPVTLGNSLSLQNLTPGPDLEGCITRFHDTSALSPSGRWVAATQLSATSQWRRPAEQEEASIILIDRESGEVLLLEKTRAFDAAMGAQVQWGRDDTQLFYNVWSDRQTLQGIMLNPENGQRRTLGGSVYAVSPDGSRVAGLDLLRLGLASETRSGPAVPAVARQINSGAPLNDGLSITYTRSGICRLELSLRKLLDTMNPPMPWSRHFDGGFYLVHLSWNRRGDRLLAVIRFRPHDARLPPSDYLISLNYPAGAGKSEDRSPTIYQVLRRDLWPAGGCLPVWHSDGDHLCLTLNLHGHGPRFVQVRYDGRDLQELAPNIPASGVPLVSSNPHHLVTAVLPGEERQFQQQNFLPLRWINLKEEEEHTVAWLPQAGPSGLDEPAPVLSWDRAGTCLVLSLPTPRGRRLWLADFRSLIPLH